MKGSDEKFKINIPTRLEPRQWKEERQGLATCFYLCP